MLHTRNRPFLIKHYARLVLVLFVASVINMSVQIPAHAAMKMQMQLISVELPEMQIDMDMDMDMDMSDCHCPPKLCDSVLAADTQSVDGISIIQWPDTRFTGQLFVMLDQDAGQLNLKQHFTLLQLAATETAPPPLLIKTLLLI